MKSKPVCNLFKKFKRFLGEKVVRPVRVKLYLLELDLTK